MYYSPLLLAILLALTPLGCEITAVCRDHGPRLDRQKTRLMWLVEDWGVDKFREAIAERMGQTLREGVHEQVRAVHASQWWSGSFTGRPCRPDDFAE